nr:neurofilament heavy polypeptide [Haemonchus contortus]
MNSATNILPSTGTRAPEDGNKDGEEVNRCTDDGKGSSEKVDDVVESLVSEVISKAEAELVEDSTKGGAITGTERRLSEPPQHRPDNNGATEERRRRIERGDSEAYIEEVLKHVFTAPTSTIIPTRLKTASVTIVKAAAPAPDRSSKPPKPVKMQESQQNTAKSAPKPVNLAKSSTKTPAEKADSVKKEEAKRPAVKKSDPVKKEETKRLAEALKSSAQGQEQEQKQPQLPAKTKTAKQPSKADSKKLPPGTDTLKSDPVLAPLKEETSDAGHIETRNSKAPPRQGSISKLQMGVSSKRHDVNSQKSDEAGEIVPLFEFHTGSEKTVTAAAPAKGDDGRNKTNKPTAPIRTTVKSSAAPTKTTVKNPVAVKRAAPPTKASKS